MADEATNKFTPTEWINLAPSQARSFRRRLSLPSSVASHTFTGIYSVPLHVVRVSFPVSPLILSTHVTVPRTVRITVHDHMTSLEIRVFGSFIPSRADCVQN